MNRCLVGFLSALLVVGALASDASAQRRSKGRGRTKAAEVEAAPVSAELSRSMGDLRWGMSKDDVQKLLEKGIADKYRPKLAQARDAMTEDRIRDAARQEIREMRSSYTRFDGTRTGWDASFLRDEFTHGNRESMLVLKDDNSQNFYFFFNDRLWKWFKAFNSEVFEGQSFGQFQEAIQRRFGAGKDSTGELSPGGTSRHWIEWQDDASRLRAVDQTGFYGFYCLVFEEKATLSNLASLRPSSGRERQGNSLVDAVTSGDYESQDHDDSPNIVDRITGHIRQRENAPAPTASGGSQGRGASGSRGQSSRPTSAPSSSVSDSDDPLSGLGL